MNRMPCSITDGPQYDDEPACELDEDIFEEQRQAEPEDSFPLELRLRMMINRLDITNAYDKAQLVQLLKDCQRTLENRTKSIASLADSVMTRNQA